LKEVLLSGGGKKTQALHSQEKCHAGEREDGDILPIQKKTYFYLHRKGIRSLEKRNTHKKNSDLKGGSHLSKTTYYY